MQRFFFLLMVVICGLLLAGCGNSAGEGTLEGKITIGPLTPVERPGQTMSTPCGVYASRKIMVYDQSGKKLVQQADINCNAAENTAAYSVKLKPGIYTVDINRSGIDHSGDVPKQVEIKSGMVVTLDISIDTGIR